MHHKDAISSNILTVVTGLAILALVFSCSYHWHMYRFRPHIIERANWELMPTLHRVEFSELEQRYVEICEYTPICEPTEDTLVQFEVHYRAKDSATFQKEAVLIDKAMLRVDSGVELIELSKDTVYLATHSNVYSSAVFRPFIHSGHFPEMISAVIDARVVDNATGEDIQKITIQVEAYWTKEGKSRLRDFLDGR